MQDKYSLFDVIVGEEYRGRDGQTKTSWTRVGTIFRETASGALSGKITPGLALTGTFIVKARTQKPEEGGQTPSPLPPTAPPPQTTGPVPLKG